MPQSDTSIMNQLQVYRPLCAKCGTSMSLTRIEPDRPDHDKRSFECQACHRVETSIFRFK